MCSKIHRYLHIWSFTQASALGALLNPFCGGRNRGSESLLFFCLVVSTVTLIYYEAREPPACGSSRGVRGAGSVSWTRRLLGVTLGKWVCFCFVGSGWKFKESGTAESDLVYHT